MPKAASKSSPRNTASKSDEREEGRRTREEGKDGRVSDCCPPCPSLLPFSLFLSSLRRLQAGGRSAWGESVGGRRAGARADRDHLRQHVQREERGAYPPSATGANRPSARPGVQSCPRRPVRCRAGGLTRRIAAGLDMDFRGEPFGPMPRLLAIAESVDKLEAVCMVCGAPASRTQRLVNGEPAHFSDPIIMVGAWEVYEARCREHHVVPGRPQSPRSTRSSQSSRSHYTD